MSLKFPDFVSFQFFGSHSSKRYSEVLLSEAGQGSISYKTSVMHKVLITFWKRNWNVNLIFSFFFFFSADHLTSTSPKKLFCRFNLSFKEGDIRLFTHGKGRRERVGSGEGLWRKGINGRRKIPLWSWAVKAGYGSHRCGGWESWFRKVGDSLPLSPPPKTLHFTPASSPSTNPSPTVETRDISKSFFISNLNTCFRV